MRLVAAALVLALSGCAQVSMSEYRALVEASREYYEIVDPIYRASVEHDASITDQSRRNRLGLSHDYGVQLDSSSARAGIAPAASPSRVR